MLDDVNEITINNKTVLLYPYQIKIIDKNDIHTELIEVKAIVSNSYFKGSYWLIEVKTKNQIVFLQHYTTLQNGTSIKIVVVPHKHQNDGQ